MSYALAEETPAEKLAPIVEILGPAGAGKTTLSRILSQRNNKVVVGVHLQKNSYIPFYVSMASLLLPTYFSQYRNRSRFTWGEIRAMVYLKAWHHVLERKTPNNGTIIVLDHGPIYRLALLSEFNPEIIKSQRLSKWWRSMLNQWAATLDMVIWLDAPDAILLDRIHARQRWHRVKDVSEQEAYTFMERYRKAFERTISMLMVDGGPVIIRLDTDKEPVHQTVDKILVAIDEQFYHD